MRYQFFTADVFTDKMFGGNQLAVFPQASGLDAKQMLQITKEFNYSETVFVLPPRDPAHTRLLRIFTPAQEIPFAGHPTIGTAFVLASIGQIQLTGDESKITLEEGVGAVPVLISMRHGKPYFMKLTSAKLPEYGPKPPSLEDIAVCLSANVSDINFDSFEPEAVSCGMPFLFIPIKSLAAIRRARLNLQVWEEKLAGYWAPHLYLFTNETELPETSFHVRMFAPASGVAEDPATGGAAAAFGGYLGIRDFRKSGTLRWTVEQGIEIGRPSILKVETEKQDGNIVTIQVGGCAVMVSEGFMEIE